MFEGEPVPSNNFARPLLAGVLGLAVAGGTAGLVVAFTVPASAASGANSAYALSASGPDPVGPQASVSSSGAVQTNNVGSFRSNAGTFSASGLTASAGAGTAKASVADLVVAGQDLGSFSAECERGVVTVHHSGSSGTGRVHVTPGGGQGSGVAATVTLSGIGGGESITVGSVTCTDEAPPTSTTTPPPPPPTSGTVAPPPPTSDTHAPPPSQGGGNGGGGSQTPPPAAPPSPHKGDIAVTG